MADPTVAQMVVEVQKRLGDEAGEVWTEEMILAMMESGLSYLFPKFYAIEPLILEGDGNTTVFTLEPTVGEEVGGVLDIFLIEGS